MTHLNVIDMAGIRSMYQSSHKEMVYILEISDQFIVQKTDDGLRIVDFAVKQAHDFDKQGNYTGSVFCNQLQFS